MIMKLLKINIISLTTKVVIWLFLVFNLGKDRSPKEFRPLLQKLQSHLETRGAVSLILFVKDIRVVWLNYLCGSPIKLRGVKSTKDGIPIIFGDLIQAIRKGESLPEMAQILNTILFCTRALSLGRDIDYTPIIGAAKQPPNDISEYVSDFWKEIGYRKHSTIPRALRWKDYHLTTKVGPNSENDNALYRAICDLTSLPPQLEASLRILGGPKFESSLDTLYNGVVLFKHFASVIPFYGKKSSFRKISGIPDKELKVRVIAIGDYFSQSVLTPLHNYLFRVLKKIPQDCTFGQDKGPAKILSAKYYSSIDLTNATDRFPISTIYAVLAGVLPELYLAAWKDVMVGYPFDIKGGKEKISYAVGNPMGFLSSWASFAVAHHYVVYYCCRKVGVSWSQLQYCLLGDDIVICDPQVAECYKQTILGLGVEFSPSKTYTSTYFFEFAKRIFYKGTEVSPFPISGLAEVSKKYYLLTQFFLEVEGKGWMSSCGIPTMVLTFFDKVLGLPSKFRKKLTDKSTIYECVQRIVRGSPQAGDLLSKAFGLLGYQFKLSNFVALNVLENIAVELFAESNPYNNWNTLQKEGKISLYLFEQKLLILSMDYYQRSFNRAKEFIDQLPTTRVVGVIHRAALDLSEEALGYSRSPGGKWPLLLKTMVFPITKDILIHRSKFLVTRTTSKIAKYLLNRAEILSFYPPEELLRETP